MSMSSMRMTKCGICRKSFSSPSNQATVSFGNTVATAIRAATGRPCTVKEDERMKFIKPILLMLFVVASVSSAQTIPCQASTLKATKLRNRVIEIDTAQDADAVAFRTELGINPDTTQVSIVTVDSVCDAVTRAVNLVSLTAQTAALYVVKFGNLY